MEVTYTKPEPGGVLYDMDQRSYDKKSLGGKSTATTMTMMTNRVPNDEDADIYDKE